MPQIEIPFTLGQRVRTSNGHEFEINEIQIRSGRVMFGNNLDTFCDATQLTLIEPVIEWRRRDEWNDWVSSHWYAKDDGRLMYGLTAPHLVGIFPNPRAIAEATQEMWNKARKV